MMTKRRITDYEDVARDAFTQEEGDMRQFVSFMIGEQAYCIDIMAVREIRVWSGVTGLPNSPAHVRGVINLRGTIVPVIDLRMRFGQGLTETTPGHVVVIVAIGDIQNGLLVDGVSDIITVNARTIAPIPDIEGEERNPYFAGLITGQDKLMAIVSLEQLIAPRSAAATAA
jgi:purine-binding chemotaxis protein CheW